MIRIGRVSLAPAGERVRLCAEVEQEGQTQILWFEVDGCYAEHLCTDRADPFVFALMPLAVGTRQDIQCADGVSERLHYQLEQYLLPALCGEKELHIHAPLRSERTCCEGIAGVFENGGLQLPGRGFLRVDTNGEELLPEDGRLFLQPAIALALQGLFSQVSLPCAREVPDSCPVPSALAYHLLLTRSASLDTLDLCLSGMEAGGAEKAVKNAPAIRIGRPGIEERDGMCRLWAPVKMDGEECTLWFETREEYGEYLTVERSDPFVVGLLPAAMARGADIVCAAPVTKSLLHRLNEYLLPTLSAHIARWNPVRVHAQATEETLPCAGAVATGWTAGTDSFYTLMKHLELSHPSRRLTHLLVANHGAIEGRDSVGTLRRMEENARAFAEGKNLSVIGVNSNVQTFDTEGFGEVGSFRSAAVGLALQKLLGVYLHSSDYAFSRFDFNKHGDGYYQLLTLGYLGSDTTVFYSAGGAVSKLVKTRALADYPLSYDALHPCKFVTRSNCGRCAKCMWTETALYAFGALEKFHGVFDVEDFYTNKAMFLTGLVRDKHLTSYGDLLNFMAEQNMEQEFITKTDRILQRINHAKRNRALWLKQKPAQSRRQESEV